MMIKAESPYKIASVTQHTSFCHFLDNQIWPAILTDLIRKLCYRSEYNVSSIMY